MSSYLEEDDSESDSGGKGGKETALSEEEKKSVLDSCAALKAEGNAHFGKSEFDDALIMYTEAVNSLKTAGLPKDCLILLNRSATYLALKRYVPALNDANQGDGLTTTSPIISCFHFIYLNFGGCRAILKFIMTLDRFCF